MVDAILFDMGGTLDGDGEHWLDRFASMYQRSGFEIPWNSLRAAFDAAEARAVDDEMMRTASLVEMVERHVGWQFEHLGIVDAARRDAIVHAFVAPILVTARRNAELLAGLKRQGFALGVVSNACGNVDILCSDLGYTSFLSVIVDSQRVGISKPDPAIYRYAAAQLRLEPAAIMMVGDSFERDVRPSKSIGMKTAWLRGAATTCPDPSLVDVTLGTLAELPQGLAAVVSQGTRERTVA
jgi:putative hydrolase of the HAD superfamily